MWRLSGNFYGTSIWESRRLFAELAEEEDFGLVWRGVLMFSKSQKGLDEEAHVAKEARELGLDVEVPATALLDPSITMNVAGSVYFPQDCHLPPASRPVHGLVPIGVMSRREGFDMDKLFSIFLNFQKQMKMFSHVGRTPSHP